MKQIQHILLVIRLFNTKLKLTICGYQLVEWVIFFFFWVENKRSKVQLSLRNKRIVRINFI